MTTIRMTMIRRLALKVLNAAARHAAPGTRDWVTAMSREMDFIENDWAALWWALGSTRILFKRQHVPLADLSGVPRAAQCLVNRIRGEDTQRLRGNDDRVCRLHRVFSLRFRDRCSEFDPGSWQFPCSIWPSVIRAAGWRIATGE